MSLSDRHWFRVEAMNSHSIIFHMNTHNDTTWSHVVHSPVTNSIMWERTLPACIIPCGKKWECRTDPVRAMRVHGGDGGWGAGVNGRPALAFAAQERGGRSGHGCTLWHTYALCVMVTPGPVLCLQRGSEKCEEECLNRVPPFLQKRGKWVDPKGEEWGS